MTRTFTAEEVREARDEMECGLAWDGNEGAGRNAADALDAQAGKSTEKVIVYLDGLKLTAALWWFIENATDESAWRTEVFFYLRERVREG